MPKSKNYELIQRIKSNTKEDIREDLVKWIEEHTHNAGDHASPWNVIEVEELRTYINEQLLPKEKSKPRTRKRVRPFWPY